MTFQKQTLKIAEHLEFRKSAFLRLDLAETASEILTVLEDCKRDWDLIQG